MLFFNNFRLVFIRTLLFSIVFYLGLETSFAQLKGRILDAKTKKALQDVNIVLIGTSIGTKSDADGQFKLQSNETVGKIQFSYLGYKSVFREFQTPNEDFGLIYLFSESILSEEILVNAQRVDNSTPMAVKTVTSDAIEKVNLGQDLPYLIQMTPSLLSSSDAGAGVGYTYMSIRGVDQARINVTVNGIPLNDAESHGVWWVNMPDFSSSLSSIQIQRGVGTSTNGSAAFGASINMATQSLSAESFAEVNSSYGSFNTQKYSVQFGTGLLKNGWAFDGRLSQISSDGYIDRASSELQSYFLNATWNGTNQLLKINVFSGKEKTYQAWWGTPEALVFGNQEDLNAYIERNAWSLSEQDINNLHAAGRRYNYYTYDNETDNYQQTHYQAHYSRKFSEHLTSNISLHYTKGSGYYETYVRDGSMENYKLNPVTINGNLITETDLIRRLWLDNDFYGLTFSSEWNPNQKTRIIFGGAANNYVGEHFGEVIWAEFMQGTPIRNRFYDNEGKKSDMNVYAKWTQEIGSWVTFADLQIRRVEYQFEGYTRISNDLIALAQLKDPLVFVNPKVGVTWNIAQNKQWFASFSVGNKEATRNEYVNSIFSDRPKNETLYDWETGYKWALKNWQIEAVGYVMNYRNQLLETGALNDVGEYIRQNVSESYRSGLELMAEGRIQKNWTIGSSLTLSRNRVKEVNQFMDNYDLDYVNGLPQQEVTVFTNSPLALSPEFIWNSTIGWSKNGFSAQWMSRFVGKQYLDNSGSNEKQIPSYWVNDFLMSYEHAVVNQTKIQFQLLINNIFNTNYAPRGYTYSYTVGGERVTENFFYPQAMRNILVQVKWSF